MSIRTFYTVKDGKGDASTITIDIPDNTATANIVLFTQQMASLLDDLIAGGITEIGFSLPVPWVAQVPDAASDLQEAAQFIFRTAGGFIKRMRIPSIWENKFSAGTRLVNQAETNVAAFIAAMEDGIEVVAGTTVSPENAHGEDVELLESAVEAWGRARG